MKHYRGGPGYDGIETKLWTCNDGKDQYDGLDTRLLLNHHSSLFGYLLGLGTNEIANSKTQAFLKKLSPSNKSIGVNLRRTEFCRSHSCKQFKIE